MTVTKACRQCQQQFEITDLDREFLAKYTNKFDGQEFPVPEPRLCLYCRMQNKMAFRNRLKIYFVKSALSGQDIFSIYPPTSLFPIYTSQEWNSENFDGREYGRDFDFSRGFFEQFQELQNAVPHLGNENQESENCDYNAYITKAKNCYYSYHVRGGSTNIYYSYRINKSETCFNSYRLRDRCSFLNECVRCFNTGYGAYLFFCNNTRDSYYCIDCHNCANCIFSHNLRNQEYCIWNQKVSRDDFLAFKQRIINGSWQQHVENMRELAKVYQGTLFANYLVNCEDSTGFALTNCQHVTGSLYCTNIRHGRYLWDVTPATGNSDSMDLFQGGNGELQYCNSANSAQAYDTQFSYNCRRSAFLRYCADCLECKNCFGCSNLHHQEYCILNKQYTKEEYEKIVAKVIQHMLQTEEWGQFFPMQTSPIPYDHSCAQGEFPLSREQALEMNLNWYGEDAKEYQKTNYVLPDRIQDTKEDVLQELLSCLRCGKNYRLIKQELEFYQQYNYPAPRECPDCRHRRRFATDNPYRFLFRACEECGKQVYTTYPPQFSGKVVCEECYLKALF